MSMRFSLPSKAAAGGLFVAAALAAFAVQAADFSVSPIRAELTPGAMSETITVSNDSTNRLRVTVKLMAWSQDAAGKDVYADTGDLVYFPRQMDVEPGAKRLIRVGAKSPEATSERTYRLFIEEIPGSGVNAPAAVTFYFRFGVPVFVPPPGAKAKVDVAQPTLDKGKLSLAVSNSGTRHVRAHRIVISDGGGYRQEVPGWYSLAGATRTYQADIPREVCRKGGTLQVKVELDESSIDRTLNVQPASCS